MSNDNDDADELISFWKKSGEDPEVEKVLEGLIESVENSHTPSQYKDEVLNALRNALAHIQRSNEEFLSS